MAFPASALPQTDPAIAALVTPLNEAQREAVTAPPDNRLVLAGAGSGKTRVLTHRIAWLMAVEGVGPHSVLAVTFTNKAANEMRGRLEQLVAVPVRAMWVGTFHGIAHKMLRLHWREANLKQNFQILDSDDQSRLVKRVLKGLDLPEERFPPKMVTSFINAQKEEGRRPHHLADSGDYITQQLVRAYAAYEQQCEAQGLVDFTELLLRAYELCRDHAATQEHYHRKFRHVLVDEFQDTNTLQYLWLRVLCGTAGKIFAVGDDDQSIYGWRGAKIENIQSLQRDFPGCEIVRLEQNYRSTGTILKAANALISRNNGRLGKNLWTDGRDGAPITLYAAYNEYDEAEFVVNRMKEILDGRAAHADLAVLYRSNAQSRVLEETLIRARLPYRIYGGVRFFERAEVKDALAWLRLISNRDDDGSFERALTTPPRGVGATSIQKLRDFARAHELSLWKAAKSGSAGLGRTQGALAQFLGHIDLLDGQTNDLPLAGKMEKLIEASGLVAHFKKEKGEQGDARVENLNELINAAKSFERPDEDGQDPVSTFLTHAALEAGEGQAAAGSDAVQLMTLHSAKGLEFPHVFLVGLENGLFPSQRAVEEGNLEEERRLAYVGVTRAREQLFVTHAESRRVHGMPQICAPSQFLAELPKECVVEMRPRAQILRSAYGTHSVPGGFGTTGGGSAGGMGSGYDDREAWRARQSEGYDLKRPALSARMRAAEPDTMGWSIGDRVGHPSFGDGVIQGFDGGGERAQVEIHFERVGTKRLMLNLARLTRL